VAAAPVGITTYDADGDRRRRRCPRGAATDVDVMMTMVGERGGEATARRRQGNGEATARRRQGNGKAAARRRRGDGKATAKRRRLQGNDEATRMRRQSAMAPQVAGATRQSTRAKQIILITNNGTHLFCLISA
jgi:regulator of protease activity HflC (stomatin/prohibitin superfamily)